MENKIYEMNIDVIIPSLSNIFTSVLLENCITTLRSAEPNIKFNVIVIESSDTIKLCGQDQTIMYDRSEFCYNHAMNQGIDISKNEWVILANNDLIFKPGFMEHILLAHAMHPDILSFSPWNSMWNWHENMFRNRTSKIIYGYGIGRELTGWCLIIKRSIFDIIKLAETVNFWYSDNVYADALIATNLKHALVCGSKVDHIVSQTKRVSTSEAIESYNQYSSIQA